MATRIVPKTELRDRIRRELADLGGDTLVVTERGRPIAVTVSIDRWNELQELLEGLEDRTAVLEHRRGTDSSAPLDEALARIEDDDVPGSARSTG